MTADNETAATGAVPPPPASLLAAAVPDLSLAAGAGTDAAAGSQLPGPAPEGVLAADALDGDFHEGQPAGNEPAAEPGSLQGTREDMAALYERITGRQSPAPALESWAPLWAEFDAAEDSNARGEVEDGLRLNAGYEAAWHRVFDPRAAAASEQATA